MRRLLSHAIVWLGAALAWAGGFLTPEGYAWTGFAGVGLMVFADEIDQALSATSAQRWHQRRRPFR